MDNGYEIVYLDKPEWGVIGVRISNTNKQKESL